MTSVEEKENLSHSDVNMRQHMSMFIFTGSDMILTFSHLGLFSGKEQDHVVVIKIFLMVDTSPRRAEPPLK